MCAYDSKAFESDALYIHYVYIIYFIYSLQGNVGKKM